MNHEPLSTFPASQDADTSAVDGRNHADSPVGHDAQLHTGEPFIEDVMLIEEVSIDGMCGVY